MSIPGSYEFRCVIRSSEEPITGSIINESGQTAEFRGWIEFAAALTGLFTERPDPVVKSRKKEGPDE